MSAIEWKLFQRFEVPKVDIKKPFTIVRCPHCKVLVDIYLVLTPAPENYKCSKCDNSFKAQMTKEVIYHVSVLKPVSP